MSTLQHGTVVRLTAACKAAHLANDNAEHVEEFGDCTDVVQGLTQYGASEGPEVDVRWQPRGVWYSYHPDQLEVVSKPS